MRKQSRSKAIRRSIFKRRWFLSGLAIIVILAAGGIDYALTRHTTSPGAATTTGNSSTQTSNSSNKIDYSPANPSDNATTNQNKGSAPATSTPPSNNSSASAISLTITEANPQKSSQSIEISALVQGATSGTCTFNFSRSEGGAVEKSYSEAVQLATNYYSCPRHSVPVPGTGNWYVSAILNSGSSTASAKWADNPVSL